MTGTAPVTYQGGLMAEHKIVHWELMGPDGDKLAAFYGDLFGWKLAPTPGFDAYNMTDAEETGIGGAVGQGNENMPQYQTIYIQVDSVDEHLASPPATRWPTSPGTPVRFSPSTSARTEPGWSAEARTAWSRCGISRAGSRSEV
jgi:hypothetical protein